MYKSALNVTRRVFLPGFIAITGILSLVACSDSPTPKDENPASVKKNSGEQQAQVQVQAGISTVTVLESTARPLLNSLNLRGATAPDRHVEVRAQTPGVVSSEPIKQGTDIKKGTALCKLDEAERKATLAQAQARLKEAQANAFGSSQLAKKGYATNNRVVADQSALEAARAQLEQIKLDIERTVITAPFDGRLETNTAELGAFLQQGDRCATIVDFDPIHVIVYPSEQEIGAVVMGAPVDVVLASGETFNATVSFIANVADEATRTFKVEATADNPDGDIRAGTTATVAIGLADTKAHFIPQSAMLLNDAGVLGVRVVEMQSKQVRFKPVTLLKDNDQGSWVQGLSQLQQEHVIVIGQNYVTDGQQVNMKKVTLDQLQ